MLKALKMVCPGRQGEMHGRLPKSVLQSDRIVAASVRDPWDWYVSTWAYGCDGEGILFDRLAKPRKILGHGYRRSLRGGIANFLRDMARPRRPWREAYADSSSPELFGRWLRLMMDPDRAGEVREDYGRSSLSQFAGLYSYLYCRLLHRTIDHLYDGTIQDIETLMKADERLNVVDHMMKTEELTEGILELLGRAKVETDETFRRRIAEMDRTNPSSRKRDTTYYYDRSAEQLIMERDALIIRKYGYRPPSLSSELTGPEER
ncbi:hypothetical protein GF402_04370 [Candidatus Fermentibacteria bacterium]|nr:hypothetical protein [Candidatus Fermentibacteria bacterium]